MKRRIVFTAFSLLLALSMSVLYSFVALSYGLQNLESPVNINFERENKLSNSINLNISCNASDSIGNHVRALYNSNEIYGDTVLHFESSADTISLTIVIGVGETSKNSYTFNGVFKLNGLVSNMKVVSSDKGTIINTVDSNEMTNEIALFNLTKTLSSMFNTTCTLEFSLADTSNFNYELNGELIFTQN